jgi:hypothetical protein
MSELIELLGQAVALLVSLLGVIVTMGALTAKARLRRRLELLRTELQAAELAYDKAVLQSLHRDTVAQIVAMDAVPTYRILAHGFAIFSIFLILFVFGLVLQAVLPGIDHGDSAAIGFVGFIGLFVVGTVPWTWRFLRNLLYALTERSSFIWCYLGALNLDRESVRDAVRSVLPLKLMTALLLSFTISVITMGLAAGMRVGRGMSGVGDSPSMALRVTTILVEGWGFMSIVASCFLGWAFLQGINLTWSHPRPLPDKSHAPANASSSNPKYSGRNSSKIPRVLNRRARRSKS